MPYIWLKLDNAAKLYPGIVSKRLTCAFRFSAYLFDEVDEARLRRATEDALARTPYYSMVVRRGLFWNYLELPEKPKVSVGKERPLSICSAMGRKSGESLIRVLHYGRKISLEASHILTDGAGALALFKDILGSYFNAEPLPHPEIGRADYLFDKYAQVCRPTAPEAPMSAAWQSRQKTSARLRATSFILDIKEVSKVSGRIGSTVGAYINALYVKSLIRLALNSPRILGRGEEIIRICMPIDLRRIFRLDTPRNFYLSLYPKFRIDDSLNVADIALSTNAQIRAMLRRDTLNAQMSRNLEGEFNRAVRSIPRAVKSLALKVLYKTSAMKPISGIYSNMGKIVLQDDLSKKISHLEFLPTPNPATRTNFGAICLGEKLCISALSYAEEPALENIFRERLISEGLEFKVYGNF